MFDNSEPVIITIDGPAASGKSTIAEKLARQLGFFYFDTGVMYRAVTLESLRQLISVDDEAKVTWIAESILIDVQPPSIDDSRMMDVFINGKDVTWAIRSPEVDQNVSKVSTYIGVRQSMTEQQRRIGSIRNTIMVGRDIGTVVFPDSKYKIFLDASPEERARRRYEEIQIRGEKASYDEILESIKRRDQIDSTRILAPLKPANDAYILNTDQKSVDQVIQEVIHYLHNRSK